MWPKLVFYKWELWVSAESEVTSPGYMGEHQQNYILALDQTKKILPKRGVQVTPVSLP